MINYSEKREYTLQRIRFHHLGGRYEGRGLMRWSPDEGFHIDAFVERDETPLPKNIEIGGVGLARESDYAFIRMLPSGCNWAVIPRAILEDRLGLLDDNRLSVTEKRVLFSRSSSLDREDVFFGGALYRTKGSIIFPDHVETVTSIAGHAVEKKSVRGLRHEADDLTLEGRHLEKNLVRFEWRLVGDSVAKTDAWKWAVALRDALSILSGQSVRLLQRETTRKTGMYVEIVQSEEALSLGNLSPVGADGIIDTKTLLSLTRCLLVDSTEADICRRIHYQLEDAQRQRSWHARELLCSTVLEAALRTLEGKTSKKYNVEAALDRFRKAHLPYGWKTACEKVKRAYRNLRHRNAHPDWLTTGGGSYSNKKLQQALDEMTLLARFYGYMIRALAGLGGLKPVFPNPGKRGGISIQRMTAKEFNRDVAGKNTTSQVPEDD